MTEEQLTNGQQQPCDYTPGADMAHSIAGAVDDNEDAAFVYTRVRDLLNDPAALAAFSAPPALPEDDELRFELLTIIGDAISRVHVSNERPTPVLNDAVNAILAALASVRSPEQGEGSYPCERSVMFGYTNYRGESAIRSAVPGRIYWGSTEWHPNPCWLLEAFDLDKGELRQFALDDCVFDRAVINGEAPKAPVDTAAPVTGGER